MARAGRKDRGLLNKLDSTGKVVWFVRLYHEGRERRFGSFSNKTQARDFYEKAKQEQKKWTFFPERYQRGGYELVKDMLCRYLATLPRSGKTFSTIADERYYGAWGSERLNGKRVNQLTSDLLEQIKCELTEKGHAPQTILHYMKFSRHVLYAMVGKSGIPENPFDKVKLKAIRAGRTPFLSPREEALLLMPSSVKGTYCTAPLLVSPRVRKPCSRSTSVHRRRNCLDFRIPVSMANRIHGA